MAGRLEWKMQRMVNCSAEMTEQGVVHVQAGPLLKREIDLRKIKGFTTRRIDGGPNGSQHELTIATSDGKLTRLHADAGERDFETLIATIAKAAPEGDFRDMPYRDTLAMMGVREPSPWMPLAVLAVFLFGMAFVAVLPQLLHALDRGEATVAVERFADPEYSAPSANISVEGRLLMGHIIEETVTTNGITSYSYYVPVVSHTWTPAEPVYAVLKTRTMEASDFTMLGQQRAFDGMLRDLLWEGLGRDETEFFNTEFGLTIAEHAVLIDAGASPADDAQTALIAFGVAGILQVVFVIVALVERRKRNR